MSTNRHSHKCETKGCTHRVVCFALQERNYDGFPEVTCYDYDKIGNSYPCDSCHNSPRCENCGGRQNLPISLDTDCDHSWEPVEERT